MNVAWLCVASRTVTASQLPGSVDRPVQRAAVVEMVLLRWRTRLWSLIHHALAQALVTIITIIAIVVTGNIIFFGAIITLKIAITAFTNTTHIAGAAAAMVAVAVAVAVVVVVARDINEVRQVVNIFRVTRHARRILDAFLFHPRKNIKGNFLEATVAVDSEVKIKTPEQRRVKDNSGVKTAHEMVAVAVDGRVDDAHIAAPVEQPPGGERLVDVVYRRRQ